MADEQAIPEAASVDTPVDLDEDLRGNVVTEYETVKLYLTGPRVGQNFVAGNPQNPIAIFTKGVLEIERSPDNAGLIRMLMKYYQCTSDKQKAIDSLVPKNKILRGGVLAFPDEAAKATAKTGAADAKT
ncbi:MAG: hypothetical protein CMB80_15045 [Flammeovirgaceae bacterium]|nr:hypothetical protein [Flammeovirgaceae bacterium]|tara:strand:+ start:223 stop:609 length:387 start_codon:yes stop_codon:yes gene_type:complete